MTLHHLDAVGHERPEPRPRARWLLEPLVEAVSAVRGRDCTVVYDVELPRAPSSSALWPDDGFRMRWLSPRRTDPGVDRCELDVLAVGAARELVGSGPGAVAQIRRQADSLWRGVVEVGAPLAGPLRVFGGLAFDRERAPAEEWREFGHARFVLPRLSVYSMPAAKIARVAIACGGRPVGDQIEDAERLLETLLVPTGGSASQARSPGSLHYSPSPFGDSRFRDDARRALQAIGRGELEKVVLARAEQIPLDRLEETAVLNALFAQAADATVFAFGFRDSLFCGATPERLVSLRGERVWSEALAGTARVGACAGSLHTEKDRREQALVISEIESRLAAVCKVLHVGEVRARSAGRVSHLHTPVRGAVASGTHVLDLVERLHPTPAVGGLPSVDACQWLREHEAFDRGWYASPIGFFDRNGEGELMVALRCGLVGREVSRLYAGAGIVAGSDPALEELETRLKLRTLFSCLQRAAQARHQEIVA